MLRRDVLRGIAGGVLGSALPARASAESAPRDARSVIVLWMNGGPSHLDTWDPKPGTRTGGSTKAIATRVKDLSVSAGLGRMAELADRLCVVRSLGSKEGNHQRAQYLGRTSYSPSPTVEHPSLGAWVARASGPSPSGLPAFVSLGGPSHGPGFLGATHGPFVVQSLGSLPDNTAAAVDDARLSRRFSLLERLESGFRGKVGDRVVDDRRALYGAARAFMKSPGLAAFDLGAESAATKAAYGDTDFGRACLTARRLVASGVRFVDVTLDGWDTHENNFQRVEALLATLDPAMSALLRDLETTRDGRGRALAESTVVVWMGDFGRSPRINARDGRDHYPQAFSAVLAGGGVKPGVVGATDTAGERIVGKGYGVADLLATVSTLAGVSPSAEATAPSGRPVAVTDSGAPIAQALA